MSDSLANLQALVRIRTESWLDPADTDWIRFEQFRTELEQRYPLLHSTATHELVLGHSMIFRWSGASDAAPTVLMAHYDVVPASDDGWGHPPYGAELSGEGEDQLVWGRGTLDDKGDLVAILEAVEARLRAGFSPQNDVYLCFGHDEETASTGGRAIAELLDSRGVRPALVLDEGGAVVEGIFPGVDSPIAVVGVSEKGSVNVRLTVDQVGGHAAMPPRFSATARLARAVLRLSNRRFPGGFNPVLLQMIRTLGAKARNPYRWIFTNLWLTRPLLLRVFSALGDETDAMLRTTQVVTMLEGSPAANALAERAAATSNIRIAIGSSVAEAVEHVRRAVNDPLVRIEPTNANEPSPASRTEGAPWDLVGEAIEEVFPGTVVTPYVMFGATDSRHYASFCTAVYRFSPFQMSREERGTLHAKNERIHVATWFRGIAFYDALLGRV